MTDVHQDRQEPGIRAVIADDEEAARARIRALLRREGDVHVVAEAGSGREAVEAVRETDPDLLFLDIRMPGLDGLEVLAELADGVLPAVIFVTAFDRYALQAFERHAVDYLLKPFDDERFREAIEHVRGRLRDRRAGRIQDRLLDLLENAWASEGDSAPDGTGSGTPRRLTRIVERRNDRIVLVDVDEVDWFEAAGDYVEAHAGDRTYLIRTSMAALEDGLGPSFARVHRSAIVRLDAIRELRPTGHGDHEIVLENGSKLRLSRTYRNHLAEALGADL